MANPYLGANPYLEQTIDKAQGDVVRNFKLTAQPAFNSAMVRSGSFGNAGVQQMNENAQRNMQDTLGNISSGMRGADFGRQQDMYRWDQEFDRSLYNDAYGQNRQSMMDMSGLLGGLQQTTQSDITNSTAIQNTPLNYWQQFTNGANSIGQGYGNSTVSGGGSNPLVGALGGAQLGSAIAKQWGGGSSGGWGGGYTAGGSAQSNMPDNIDVGGGWSPG
jgi:hypothetical protein